jgi:hypothetical protein
VITAFFTKRIKANREEAKDMGDSAVKKVLDIVPELLEMPFFKDLD